MNDEQSCLVNDNFHSISADEALQQLHSRTTGLTREEALLRRELDGLNIISSPLRVPKWLCCLLPCLAKTPAMRLFHDITPEYCEVQRGGIWRNIDSSGVVKGDIIRIIHGMYAPADLRIIQVCLIDCLDCLHLA